MDLRTMLVKNLEYLRTWASVMLFNKAFEAAAKVFQ